MIIFFFEEEAWPLEDLAVRYEIMITKGTKIEYDDRRGKIRYKSITEQGFSTKAGEMTKAAWRQQAEAIIHENGLEELLEAIKDHCRRHCAWLRKESELELFAMECLASRAYEAWTEFGKE